ncbi:SDR family NAD(P)-dependent oxidoreductase [Yinghuangia sp. ASG 101]|uniref:type I polyketide synthase n=1 Tax=Yinghuangia sp. ASG 101 TaxID=2896848 RepID=UPI001E31B5F0|nr:type I polyketide synthase [Yinghuangia sp. ASG 101]UGQ11305.1 SDR family NAD(P)-dependent oxidoreductase [Yinghuangia sp. ASG 101]
MTHPHDGAGEPVAIIGIGCRLPGGITGHDSLWNVLVNGVDAIGPIPPDRWDVDRYYSPKAQQPGRMSAREGGFLENVDAFDAAFFGISGRVAAQMDPQQRLLMEVCWETFEDAGVVPDTLVGSRTGVFLGACSQDYGGLQGLPSEIEGLGPHSATGTFMSILSNRLSYTFDLRGPSMTIDTACSSSLVAVHLACRSLATGESELAIAGGVNVMLTPQFAIALSQAAMLSPDARSKAFDAAANGYVRGEGAGVVVLKPLSRAERDGDRVYAVIRGTAVNQDGRTQGITVPSEDAQAENFRAALAVAGIAPGDVGYIEAHGTGTPVGDPIEANALGRVLAADRDPDRVAFVGSIKTNIGHLEAGAGIAGLIKAALSVHHRQIVPSLHFQAPNPHIDFAGRRLAVPTSLRPWPAHYSRAVASVNSFGFGGTNANVVLDQAPEPRVAPAEPPSATHSPTVLTLSARSEPALRRLARDHAERLDRGPVDLERLGANLALRRTHHQHRLAVIASAAADAAEKLRGYAEGERAEGVIHAQTRRGTGPGKIAFVFNGQGPQWFAMGRTLLETSPVFRAKIQECDRIARPYLGWSILEALTAPDEASSRVQETHCLQPTMFALQVALTELWKSWGVVPDGVAGHSMGELAAAHVSGALTLDAALRVICHRARIQERADPAGAMMFVAVGPDEAQALCAGRPISLAARNSPRASTLSGRRDALEALAAELRNREVFARVLRVNCACHSADMDPLHDDLMIAIDGVEGGATTTPMYSTVTGARIAGGELSASYWWRNFREPVLFAPAIHAMLADGFDAFVELSPHPVLANSLKEILADAGSDAPVVSTLARDKDDWERFLGAFATLYTSGREVDWRRRHPDGVPTLDLPSNPWMHESFWNETETSRRYRSGGQSHPMLKRVDVARPTWEIKWDDHRLAWVKEHDVFGSVIVPGAAYIEAALAAARELTGEACALDFVEFERACILGDQPHVSRVELDPDEGTFEFHHRAVHEAGWVRNVRGRFHRDSGAPPTRSFDLDAIRARCSSTYSAADVYGRLRANGYAYGPAFCGISRLYVGPGEGLARVETPRVLKKRSAGYLFHPALLDACFQSAILHPSDDRPDELLPFTYLPTGIERVRVHSDAGIPAWCHTRVRRLDATGLSVDIHVLDEAGNLLGEYAPLHGKVLRQSRADGDSIDNHFYRFQWKADREHSTGDLGGAPRPGALTLRADELRRQLEPVRHTVAERLDRTAYTADYQDTVRRLCADYVADCLREFGVGTAVGDVFSIGDFTDLLPRYRRALGGFLRFLVEDGFLSEHDGRYRVELARNAETETRWAEALTEYPSCVWELLLLRATGTHLRDVLVGRTDPLELLFPQGSPEDTEPIYQTSPIARFHNVVMKKAVETLARTADPRRTLRVLEVGGGTGGLTAHVLTVLPSDRCAYTFTDVSPAFVQGARERFRDHGFLDCRTLDLENDLQDQGIAAGSFDLVLAADVVHATTDVKRTLSNLGEALAPGGVLALIEAEPGNRWLDLTFGLTDGWWASRDLVLRPDGPLLTLPGWDKLLRSVGYDDVVALGDPRHAGAGGQSVLLAVAPGQAGPHADSARVARPDPTTETGDWLILSEPGGLAAELARRLTERGGNAVIVPPRNARGGEPDEYDRLIAPLHLQGVIQLQDSATPPDRVLDGAALDTAGRALCLDIVHVIRAVDRRAPATWPKLYVLTRGAHAFRNATPALQGASAWGLGLVVGLEAPQARCAMIDLDPVPDPGEADAVWAELWAADHEREVVLRAGERFTRRLVPLPADTVRSPTPASDLPADTGFALGTETPGALDHLSFHASPRTAPKPGHVEVEVAAAGLNFLDVLTALGQVPLLESARTHRFGAECAGVVTRVGEGVSGLEVGDPVVAVVGEQGTIASHLTVDAAGVVRKPDTLTFEEAASIPIVFLTAWYALHKLARLRAGERVLIHAASGGTGLAALQIARRAGAEVFATAGSPKKRALLRSLGVRHVLDSRSLDFAEDILEATAGAGVDVVLNSIAGEAVDRSIACLAPYGRFVELGKVDLLADRRLGLRPFLRNLAYFGFDLRQLLMDRPQEVRAELEELMRLFAAGELHALPHRVFPPSETETAFRHLAGSRHIGKLVIAMDEGGVPVRSVRDTARTQPHGTWLITGGLGGVGLSMAESLADAGARHLVLLGRSGAGNDEAKARVDALRGKGITVVVESVDVTSHDDLSSLLDRIDGTLPPLRGVLHCAMVLDDALTTDLNEDRLASVMRPKALGAWNLHELTRHLPLDAFVMFSSATSMIGNRGQANYAAANAFLDHLAEARRSWGLPALSVNWGAVSDAGYLARNQDIGRAVAATGMRSLTAAQAFEALTALGKSSFAQVGVLPMDWPTFFRHHGLEQCEHPRYDELFARHAGTAGIGEDATTGGNLRHRVAARTPEAREQLVKAALGTRVAAVLGIPHDALEEDMPLMDYLDSLLAVELSSWIERELGAKVTIMELMKGPSLEELSGRLVEQLGDKNQSPAVS